MDNLSEQFFRTLGQHQFEDLHLNWPSPSFTELKMSVGGIQVGKSISFILPCNHKFQDSMGFLHPGYLSLAFNEAFYCFAFSIANRPCLQIQTNFSLVTPVPINSSALILEISISAKSRKFLLLSGKAKNYREKTHALATSIVTPYSVSSSSD